jgi:DNA/RNA endonuclease YhcR with UshA esterase domain
MKDFFEKNKIPISIIAAAFIIAGSIWLSNKPALVRQGESGRQPTPQQLTGTAKPINQSAVNIDYTQSPDHIGEYACVTGKVDHVYTSQKGTIFINFCSDYKTCPFVAVIFASDADKFSNPAQYGGKTVEISGLVRTYQGQAEIILNDPAQIEIK